MQTFETAAIISLIDHLSGPLRALAAKTASTQGVFAQHAQKMAEVGQRMTWQMTVPIVAMGKHLADGAREFSVIENQVTGVLLNRHLALIEGVKSTEQYREANKKATEQVAALKEAASDFYKDTKGLANPLEFMKAAQAGIKSGFVEEDAATAKQGISPTLAAARAAFNLSQANKIELGEAMDQILTLSQSLGIATKDKNNNVLPADVLQKNANRIADMIATARNNGMQNSQEVFDSFKLSAPMARATGVTPEVLAAFSATLSEGGFRGSEIGVALRSFMGAFLAPKSNAAQILSRRGIQLASYMHWRKDEAGHDVMPTADSFMDFAKRSGYVVGNQAKVREAFTKHAGDWDFISEAMAQGLLHAGKKNNPVKPDTAAKFADKFIALFEQSIDLPSILNAIRAKGGLTGGEWKQIGEGRQFPRLAQLITAVPEGARDVTGIELGRFYDKGQLYDEKGNLRIPSAAPGGIDAIGMRSVSEGAAERQMQEHAKKLDAAYQKMAAAHAKIIMSLADSGAFEKIADKLVELAQAVANMDVDKMGQLAKGAMLLAAVGPALWMGGSLAQVALAIGAIGKALWGMTAVAKALQAASVASTALSATGAMTPIAAGMSAAGTAAASQAAVRTVLLGAAATGGWALVGAGVAMALPYAVDAFKAWMDKDRKVRGPVGLLARSEQEIAATVGTNRPGFKGGALPLIAQLEGNKPLEVKTDVQGTITGEAQVKTDVNVSVKPSPEFMTSIDKKISQSTSMKLDGKLGKTMAGSNGAQPVKQ